MTADLSPQLAAAAAEFDRARDTVLAILPDLASMSFADAAARLLERCRAKPAPDANALMLALLSVLQEQAATAQSPAPAPKPRALAAFAAPLFRRRPSGAALPAHRPCCAGDEASPGRISSRDLPDVARAARPALSGAA